MATTGRDLHAHPADSSLFGDEPPFISKLKPTQPRLHCAARPLGHTCTGKSGQERQPRKRKARRSRPVLLKERQRRGAADSFMLRLDRGGREPRTGRSGNYP